MEQCHRVIPCATVRPSMTSLTNWNSDRAPHMAAAPIWETDLQKFVLVLSDQFEASTPS